MSISWQYFDCSHGHNQKEVKPNACFLHFMKAEYHLELNCICLSVGGGIACGDSKTPKNRLFPYPGYPTHF